MKYSPLHAFHVERGAKMADFGGWDMPIEYPAIAGGGVLNEHQAVRERVGLFDVSHLGKALVQGPGARDFLNSILTNDLNRISPGQAQYTLLCDDASGGVVDDLIAYCKSDDEFFLIPNAANCADVVGRIEQASPAEIAVTNQHAEYGIIALQGPLSLQVLERLSTAISLEYMSFAAITFMGSSITVCRTGYTGELGYELVVPWNTSLDIWRMLVDVVESVDGRVAGLGARDTLRTEMCYPLHGHELSLDISPVEASAQWAIGWKKERFWGKTVLEEERRSGNHRRLFPLQMTSRGIPRAGMLVYNTLGKEIGVVTSGTFSPTLKKGIALALLSAGNIDDVVEIDIRGTRGEAQITKAPFVPSHVK